MCVGGCGDLDFILEQLSKDPGCTLWQGVALDLENLYAAKIKKPVVFWGFTSTTSFMGALDAFIPTDSPQVLAISPCPSLLIWV